MTLANLHILDDAQLYGLVAASAMAGALALWGLWRLSRSVKEGT